MCVRAYVRACVRACVCVCMHVCGRKHHTVSNTLQSSNINLSAQKKEIVQEALVQSLETIKPHEDS